MVVGSAASWSSDPPRTVAMVADGARRGSSRTRDESSDGSASAPRRSTRGVATTRPSSLEARRRRARASAEACRVAKTNANSAHIASATIARRLRRHIRPLLRVERPMRPAASMATRAKVADRARPIARCRRRQRRDARKADRLAKCLQKKLSVVSSIVRARRSSRATTDRARPARRPRRVGSQDEANGDDLRGERDDRAGLAPWPATRAAPPAHLEDLGGGGR